MVIDYYYYTIIFLLLFFVVMYLIIPLNYYRPSNEFVNFMNTLFISKGFQGDSTIKHFISTITNLLVTALTILSAVYVFTHREQKSVSPSLYNEKAKNRLVVFSIIFIFLTILIGNTLITNLEYYINMTTENHPLHGTRILIYKIYLWLLLITINIVYLIELIKYLFISMNSNRMLKSSIKSLHKTLDALIFFYRHKRFEDILKDQYKIMHLMIESIFQYLKFLGDNNMNNDFDEYIDSLNCVLNKFKQPKSKLKIDNLSSYLLSHDRTLFIDIYKSLLRNTLSLILHLYKNSHFNKGKKVTDLYFSIFLDADDILKQHFILSLNEFTDSLDYSNERQIKHFLTGLKQLPDDSTLIIYKNLIQKLIIKGNIEMLTSVVYDFKEHSIDERRSHKQNPMSKAMATQNINVLKSNAIIILLQSLLKSIEISRYGITGFLVKYMITNFKGDEINQAYKKLKQKPDSFTSIFEANEDNPEGLVESEIILVSLNAETFKYCCKKMIILLYGQQLFAKKEKLWFVKNEKEYQSIDIEQEFKNCSYSSYVMKKVKSVDSKYGLLFFEDEEILKNIRKKMNIENAAKILLI